MHALFSGKLRELGLPFVEISGDRAARVANAVRAVERLLS